jgi:DNA-directed RNA polymerase subunit RPC12/RpoP
MMKAPTENLKPLMRCSVCDKPFQSARVLVLGEEDERTTLHVQCEACGMASIVFVSNGRFGVMSVGMLTDLVSEDAQELFGREPVSADQVIEVHTLLKASQADIHIFV